MNEPRVPEVTLRDYFAAQAMQAMLSDPQYRLNGMNHLATWAYRHADAMLEARDRK